MTTDPRIEQSNIKTSSSILLPAQMTARKWRVQTLDASGKKPYGDAVVNNDDVIDVVKQVMYEGKATKVSFEAVEAKEA